MTNKNKVIRATENVSLEPTELRVDAKSLNAPNDSVAKNNGTPRGLPAVALVAAVAAISLPLTKLEAVEPIGTKSPGCVSGSNDTADSYSGSDVGDSADSTDCTNPVEPTDCAKDTFDGGSDYFGDFPYGS